MCEKKNVDKYKQMWSSRQNDKLEQWVINMAVNVKVQGSNLSDKKEKFF